MSPQHEACPPPQWWLEAMCNWPVGQAVSAAVMACGSATWSDKCSAALVAAAARGATQGMQCLGQQTKQEHSDAYDPLGYFESLLLEVASKAGKMKMSVTEAKAWLRQHGQRGRHLASRLGAISKYRNRAGHPDVGLRADIAALVVEHTAGAEPGGTVDPVQKNDEVQDDELDESGNLGDLLDVSFEWLPKSSFDQVSLGSSSEAKSGGPMGEGRADAVAKHEVHEVKDGECVDLQGVRAELEAMLAGPPPVSHSEVRRWEFLSAEEKRLREKRLAPSPPASTALASESEEVPVDDLQHASDAWCTEDPWSSSGAWDTSAAGKHGQSKKKHRQWNRNWK